MSQQNQNPPEVPLDEEHPFGGFDITKIDHSEKPVQAAKVLGELMPEGTNVKAEELVDMQLIMRHMEIFTGEFGPALWCIVEDEKHVVYNTVFGGQVLCKKLWALRSRLPVQFTLRKVDAGQYGGYYDLE